jgi:hypothetical protein
MGRLEYMFAKIPAKYAIWFTVKQAMTIAIPGKVLNPWMWSAVLESTASTTLDPAIASQENDPKAKPVAALSASRTITALIVFPLTCQFGSLHR